MSDPRPPSSGDTITVETGTVHTRHGWTVTSPSTTVVETVAVALDREPTSLPALYETIDPDALDAICTRASSAGESGNIQISFTYAGREITVMSDGVLVVGPMHGAI